MADNPFLKAIVNKRETPEPDSCFLRKFELKAGFYCYWYSFSFHKHMRKLLLILFITTLVQGCKDKGTETPSPVTAGGEIRFNFRHYYKGQAMEFSGHSTSYTNEAGNPYSVQSLKYFISKLVLYKANGESYDVNMYKLVNAGETSADTFKYYVLKNIPEGTYTRLSFVFGVDTARNKFPFGLVNNSSNNSMEWPYVLGGGYHFMMYEGLYRTEGDTLRGFGIHLGKNPNQAYIEFDDLDIQVARSSSQEMNIEMNIDKWFDGVNIIDLNDGYGYIMEDDAKQLLFKQNAAGVFKLK